MILLAYLSFPEDVLNDPYQPDRQMQGLINGNKFPVCIRKNLSIHSFRSGYATLLYKMTGDLLLVSIAMGHRNINSTGRYVENNIFAIQKAVEEIYR